MGDLNMKGSPAMSKKLPRCRFCGEPFHPDPYNASRQKFCKRPECVRERKRMRQRRWYNQRRRDEPAFRESENARCAQANRRRRSMRNARPEPAQAEDAAFFSHVVTGFLSQVIDSSDPVHLHNCLCGYADRGRRVAYASPTGKDPP